MGDSDGDSPFSITANVAGVLTFVVAIAAAVYARLTYLRNSDDEYMRVKQSLAWYKTESTWLGDLLQAQKTAADTSPYYIKGRREDQMFAFVMDDVLNLERRLLEIISDIEVKAATAMQSNNWTVLPRTKAGRPSVALEWLSVRGKAMELVRQREALTTRVQFLHLSMISSRMGAVEHRLRRAETSGLSETQTRVNSFN